MPPVASTNPAYRRLRFCAAFLNRRGLMPFCAAAPLCCGLRRCSEPSRFVAALGEKRRRAIASVFVCLCVCVCVCVYMAAPSCWGLGCVPEPPWVTKLRREIAIVFV